MFLLLIKLDFLIRIDTYIIISKAGEISHDSLIKESYQPTPYFKYSETTERQSPCRTNWERNVRIRGEHLGTSPDKGVYIRCSHLRNEHLGTSYYKSVHIKRHSYLKDYFNTLVGPARTKVFTLYRRCLHLRDVNTLLDKCSHLRHGTVELYSQEVFTSLQCLQYEVSL